LHGQSLSPSIVTSAGGSMLNSEVSLDYSICEPIIETMSNSDVMLTQGFEQPEITLTSILEYPEFDLRVFPNPTASSVNIISDQTFSLELLDLKGAILTTRNDIQLLDLSSFPSATYLLRITINSKTNTYKIIKQ